MTFIEYVRPCKTRTTRDNFAAHVARGSVLPGLDYACNIGDKVFASAKGRVTVADHNAKDETGMSIVIHHADGNETHYLHLSAIKVKQGDRVEAGDLIALSGNTGTTSTGPHLHFAIKRHGKCIDPAKWFKQNRKEAKAIAAAAGVPVVTTELTEGDEPNVAV